MKRVFSWVVLCLLAGSLCRVEGATATVILHNTSPGIIRDGVIQKDGASYTGAGLPFPLSAGTYTGSMTTTPGVLGGMKTFTLRYQDANFIYYVAGQSYAWDANADVTMEFWANGSNPPPPQDWKLDTKICNDTKSYQVYSVYVGGVFQAKTSPLAPGECFNFHYQDASKKQIDFKREQLDQNGNAFNSFSAPSITTSDSNWYQGSTSPGITSRQDDKTGVVLMPDGTPTIEFNDSATSPATEDTLRRVGEAIYDSTSQSAVQSSLSGQDISGKLSALQNAVNSGFVNVDGRLVSVQGALNTLNTSVQGLATTATAINSGVASVASAVNAVGSKVDTVNNKLDGLGGKLDTANSTLSSLKTTTDNAYAKFVSIDSSLTGLGDKLTTLHSDDQIVIGQLEDLNDTADGLAKESTLTLFKSDTHTDLGQLSAKVVEVKDAVNTADTSSGSRDQARLNKLSDIDSHVAAQTAQLDGRLQAANSTLQNIDGNLSALKNANHTDLGAIAAALEGVYNAVNGVGNGVAAFKAANHSDHEALLGAVTNGNQEIVKALGTNTAELKSIHRDLTNENLLVSAAQAAGQSMASGVAGDWGVLTNAFAGPAMIGWQPIPQDTFWTVSWASGPFHWIVDLNPINWGNIAEWSAWFRNLLSWLATVLYVLAIYDCVMKAWSSGALITAPANAGRLPGFKQAAQVAICIGITFVLGSLPALGWTWYYSHLNTVAFINSNPLESSNTAISQGVWLALQFVPVGVIIANIFSYFVFKMNVATVYWFASTTVRVLMGL
jgi:septal ring factor EnvC (AmiA/AmiB activator)